ncbi:BQ5605_C013g07090 [Microbotryum silenes-dioicae]|uniref:BQ5605_C013g07090 protein n=1 Tax=Microbotryum silenes-dioicae TaxID=796604 RepID=A0A2X0LU89_9BASI|nr:BQ5605_C013g07090 [Microbotryum silenes-dioicae]
MSELATTPLRSSRPSALDPAQSTPLLPTSPSSPVAALTESAKKAVSFAAAPVTSASSSASSSSSSSSSPISSASNAISSSILNATSASASPSTSKHASLSDTPSNPASLTPQPKRRRSSLKAGTKMPVQPPPEHWKHADPLLRRLRLRDPLNKGHYANLQHTFRDAKVVLFMFGSTWPGMSREPYQLVERFARENPHRCKVVYVSVDTSEATFNSQIQGKPWLAMEWNDGSNLSEGSDSSDHGVPSEPFLLAGDTDLEEDLHHSDPQGSLYTRPYSRVFLAEKHGVLGVPNLLVYHLEKREVLTTHARFDLLKPERWQGTWEKWERGEKISFSLGDVFGAMKWTLAFAAAGTAYLAAVHLGGAPNLIHGYTETLSRTFLTRGA